MAPETKSVLFSLGLAAFAAGCERPSHISKEAHHHIADAKMESIHTIVMPHDEPVFPPGPGRDELVTACVVCHSPRYITMQPRFSRTEWLAEVNKMKNVYGAHISDEQVLKITDYVVSINGEPDAADAPNVAKYGE
jgi:sulfite dehydrogenase (cytochrome) subunit B